MNRKKIIRRTLMLAAWLMVISGITTLLVAANRKQNEHLCREVLIGIKGTDDKTYVEKEDLLKLIEKTGNGSLIKKPVTMINLAKLEKELKKNPWIKNAQLYFDSKDALHVFVEEREPVARVFTISGNSFYMDGSGYRMPLLERISIRVPVITGFTDAKKFDAADSVLLIEVKQVATFIYNNQFWNAQIGQIDITSDQKFELIPVIGDHIIRLGPAENIEGKLERLYVFYKQVMSKVGFNKYGTLDVQYNDQVVAVKKAAVSKIDSVQLQKNIEELMNHATFQNIDEEMWPQKTNSVSATIDSAVSKTAQVNSVSTKTNPNPTLLNLSNQNIAKEKSAIQSKPTEKLKKEVKTNNVKKPKAVMPAKVN